MISAKNRYVSRVKALRKCKLDLQIKPYSKNRGLGLYDNLHQYSKNKIHCSCSLCRAKRMGNRMSYLSIAEQKKISAMEEQLLDF